MNDPNALPPEPLSGLRVLLTRTPEDNEALRISLEALGATVVELPAIDRVPPADWGPADAALQHLDRYAWTVFTSRATVEAVFARLGNLVGSASLPPHLQVAAVGPATARNLEGRGVHVSCTGSEAGAEALARALIARGIAGQKVLLPGSDLARPELPEALERAGATVEKIEVYRTTKPQADHPGQEALRKGLVDVVTFTSPSSVHNLVDMLGGDTTLLERAALVCIGPTTAHAVRTLGLSPAAVAEPHTAEGIADAIVRLAGGKRPNDKQ